MTKETGMLVQKLRLQRGWSQEQLAVLCALSARTIQWVERGQTAGAESLKALASVFEVDFLDLKEADMDKPNTLTVSAEEALAFARVRRIKGFYLHPLLSGVFRTNCPEISRT
ncbi:MAG TPA: helix-turn-helix transcriptional regulator [Acetobacteraceae bacterium]|jgi:transcriptional regulator with XRE-family HTH domain